MWSNEFITYKVGLYLHLIGISKYERFLEMYKAVKTHR